VLRPGRLDLVGRRERFRRPLQVEEKALNGEQYSDW
jgi:hypothetical protein